MRLRHFPDVIQAINALWMLILSDQVAMTYCAVKGRQMIRLQSSLRTELIKEVIWSACQFETEQD